MYGRDSYNRDRAARTANSFPSARPHSSKYGTKPKVPTAVSVRPHTSRPKSTRIRGNLIHAGAVREYRPHSKHEPYGKDSLVSGTGWREQTKVYQRHSSLPNSSSNIRPAPPARAAAERSWSGEHGAEYKKLMDLIEKASATSRSTKESLVFAELRRRIRSVSGTHL